MSETRVPSVPLITIDPFFSIWSPADTLNGADTQSWTNKSMPIRGIVSVDGIKKSVIGEVPNLPKMRQNSIEITPTQTIYEFSDNSILLRLTFAQHFDLKDLQTISEPLTYVEIRSYSLDKSKHNVEFEIQFDSSIVYEDLTRNRIIAKKVIVEDAQEIFMGKGRQTPLNYSGDLTDIDWGYLHLATLNAKNSFLDSISTGTKMQLQLRLDLTCQSEETVGQFLIAYDDLQAIDYFGYTANAYWKKEEPSITQLLRKRLQAFNSIILDCKRIDNDIRVLSDSVGGNSYSEITAIAYRQAIAAHKLIRDSNENIVFLSKECNSNGCIGTVDVSYPSIPLFLAFNPELVEGMMRPIFKFTQCSSWNYDFAPHDVGRYPYATGQVYGLKKDFDLRDGETAATLYDFPESSQIYELNDQMPIEECGNMVIMASTVDLITKSGFLEENYDQLAQWAEFLLDYGQDPNNQLCTDDFAGHLAHNANLSLKAIVAVMLFGKALVAGGKHTESGERLMGYAKSMARIWTEDARSETDTRLAFDQPNTWSLKYNLVWDDIFSLGLFNPEIRRKELKRYLSEANEFGVPLDSRATYTKADWLMWIATMADKREDFDQFTSALLNYLIQTPSREPFSDWYDTNTGKMVGFKNRSVIAGVYMPLLKAVLNNESKHI